MTKSIREVCTEKFWRVSSGLRGFIQPPMTTEEGIRLTREVLSNTNPAARLSQDAYALQRTIVIGNDSKKGDMKCKN